MIKTGKQPIAASKASPCHKARLQCRRALTFRLSPPIAFKSMFLFKIFRSANFNRPYRACSNLFRLHPANLELSAVEAINWAMKGRNTTKKGPIPGGLGLKLLRDFIEINKGRIQIVSDLAYWEFTEGAVSTKEFSTPFTGTAVNIEINTADTQSYCLASELRPENVF